MLGGISARTLLGNNNEDASESEDEEVFEQIRIEMLKNIKLLGSINVMKKSAYMMPNWLT